MRAFFEGIQTLFVDYLFIPHNALRKLELTTWFGANIINWLLVIIGAVAMVYWIKQLKLHEENGEENHDITAHSFLK